MHFSVNCQTECLCKLVDHEQIIIHTLVEFNLGSKIVCSLSLYFFVNSNLVFWWWVICILWYGLYISALKVFFKRWIVRPSLLSCEGWRYNFWVFLHSSHNAAIIFPWFVRLLVHQWVLSFRTFQILVLVMLHACAVTDFPLVSTSTF